MSATTKFDTVDLYSHWASALINNDWSGLDDEDAEELKAAFVDLRLSPDNFVDVSSGTFFGTPDCAGLPGDIATYPYRIED